MVRSGVVSSVSLLRHPKVPFSTSISLLILSCLVINCVLGSGVISLFQERSLGVSVVTTNITALLVLRRLLVRECKVPERVSVGFIICGGPVSMCIVPILCKFIVTELDTLVRQDYEELGQFLTCVKDVAVPVVFLRRPLGHFYPLTDGLLFCLLVKVKVPILFSVVMDGFGYYGCFKVPGEGCVRRVYSSGGVG